MTPRVREYCRDAADQFGITPEMVMARGRRNNACAARKLVMRRLRADGFTYPQIGRWMGRHHTTVMGAVNPQAVDNNLCRPAIDGE